MFALDTAVTAARAAGAELNARFHGPRTVAYKGKLDLVTDADEAAEGLILRIIRERHPDDGILAEESGKSGETTRQWVIDPLDGTTNYAHGIPHFCVSIGYRIDGVTEVGVVYDPTRDELFAATRGGGATLNGATITVSAVDTLERAVLGTGFPYWTQERPTPVLALFSAFAQKTQGLRRFGAAALDLCWVACGRLDGFFELGLKPWDTCAGARIINESGGLVTAPNGALLRDEAGDIAAANPVLHAAMVRVADVA